MYDATLSLCERIVYQLSFDGTVPRPEGDRHPLLSPFDILPATDGWVAIAAPNNNRWVRLYEFIDRVDLAVEPGLKTKEPGLKTNEARVARRQDVYDVLEGWTRSRSRAEILACLGGEVPVGDVRDAAEIMADPHVAARGMAVSVDHPGSVRKVTIAGQPVKFSRTPAVPLRRAPLLDEHGPETWRRVAK